MRYESPVLQRLTSLIRSPTLIYLAASAVGRLGSIFLIPLYTRALQPEEFGTLSLASTLQSLFPLIFSLGLNAALSKVYFDTPVGEAPEGRVGAVARAILKFVSLATVLTGACVILLWPAAGLGDLTRHRLLLVLGASAGVAFTSIPDIWYRAQRRAVSVGVLNLGSFLLSVALSITFVVGLDRGLDGVLEANCCASLLTGLWGCLFVASRLRLPGGAPSATFDVWATVRFSIHFVPHYIASWAFSVGDRWVLKAIGAGELLGLYAVGQQLSSPIGMVGAATNEVAASNLGEAYRSRGRAALREELAPLVKQQLFASGLTYGGLLILIPVLFMVLGPHFQQGVVLLPFVGLASVIESAYFPPVNVLFYGGKSASIPIITTIAAVIGLIVTASLTLGFGMVGLVSARFLSSLCRTALFLIWARRVAV